MRAFPLHEAKPSMTSEVIMRTADVGVVFVDGHLRIDHIRLHIPPAIHRIGHREFTTLGPI